MITVEDLRAYYRFEVDAEQFNPGESGLDEPCYVTIDDAEEALINIQRKNVTAKDFAAWVDVLEWNCLVESALCFCSKKAMKKFDPDVSWEDSEKTEADFLYALKGIYRVVEESVERGDCEADSTDYLDFARIFADIRNFREGKLDSIEPTRWSPFVMREWLLFMNEDELVTLDEETLQLFRTTVDELCEKGNVFAMEKKAYCLYGGNAAYKCDWKESRDLLLALMARDDVYDRQKFTFANTLGYIYYYGRCTEGEPDYDAAFRYFTLGLAGGYYESAYKLADMFKDGKGTEKNELAAFNLVSWAYDQNFGEILLGNAHSKFADVALRLGMMFRDGVAVKEDRHTAYELFTQADFALRIRADAGGYFGDEKVNATVQKALRGMRKEFPDAAPCKYYESSTPHILADLFDGSAEVAVRITHTKKGISISAQRLQPSGVLITLPEYGYCETTTRIKQKARKVKAAWFKGLKGQLEMGESATFTADAVSVYKNAPDGEGGTIEFSRDGNPLVCIAAETYLFRVDWSGFRSDMLI